MTNDDVRVIREIVHEHWESADFVRYLGATAHLRGISTAELKAVLAAITFYE